MEAAIILASLIVGVAITDQLTSLHRLLTARGNVKWHPLPLIVAFTAFLLIVMIWGAIARPVDGPLSIAEFLPMLVTLVLLFLLGAATLPDELDEPVTDLGAFYDRRGPYIWSLFTLLLAWGFGADLVEHVREGKSALPFVSGRVVDLLFLCLMISLIVVRRRWYHWLGVAVLALGPITWLSRTMG